MTERFPVTSRYHGVETREIETADGRTHVHLARRFLPPSDSLQVLELHPVAEGERLDHVAHQRFGDSQQSWRLCDANDAMRPEELTEEIGRELRVTLPEGVRGPVL
jgi:hypothetical protein